MTDDRNPEEDRHPETPDGYFGWPEGYGNVEFLDEHGKPMTRDQWLAYVEEKRREDRGETTEEP